MATTKPWCLIVGAGPSGLLLGLMLAKQGIPVHILEGSDVLDDSPRAAYYGPPAAFELGRAGVLPEIRAQGHDPVITCWRKLDGTMLAHFDCRIDKDYEYRLACMPLKELDQLLYKHAIAQSTCQVSFNHRVTDVGQDEDKAWVECEVTENGQTEKKRFEAPYVVGCDGASSRVRKCLFGDRDFPGWSWDRQIVATNVRYDFAAQGYEDIQFIIHPEHWHMVARLTKEPDGKGWWRVSYGENQLGLTKEELVERLPQKFETILPGHPKPDQYTIAAINPYKTHQRLADKMAVGRICLAADAAHLCNPFGGLGLTGGIVDVGGLYDCLYGMHSGKADHSILEDYSRVRREKYQQLTDPISQENIRRLFDQDPDKALENDEFLKMLKGMEGDDVKSREFLRAANAMRYDFTQHYKGNQNGGESGDKDQATHSVEGVDGPVKGGSGSITDTDKATHSVEGVDGPINKETTMGPINPETGMDGGTANGQDVKAIGIMGE